MAKTHYIYSTLTGPVDYTNWGAGGADLKVPSGNVRIHGGANIPDGFLRTPQGVVTPVTSDELEHLRANEVFKLHEANGFIVVSDKKVDPEVVAADMESRDPSAPLVEADLTAKDPEPKLNTPSPRGKA